jgi:hypothetical protein
MSPRALVVVRALDGTQYFVNDRNIAEAMLLAFRVEEKPIKEMKAAKEKFREEEAVKETAAAAKEKSREEEAEKEKVCVVEAAQAKAADELAAKEKDTEDKSTAKAKADERKAAEVKVAQANTIVEMKAGKANAAKAKAFERKAAKEKVEVIKVVKVKAVMAMAIAEKAAKEKVHAAVLAEVGETAAEELDDEMKANKAALELWLEEVLLGNSKFREEYLALPDGPVRAERLLRVDRGDADARAQMASYYELRMEECRGRLKRPLVLPPPLEAG